MLTDAICRNPPKLGKLSDKDGLYLLVREQGKYWRLDYRFQGLRKTAAFGVYPKVSLKEARAQCALFRQKLAQGIDPNAEKKRTKASRMAQESVVEGNHPHLFENVIQSWFEVTCEAKAWSAKHREDMRGELRRYLLPAFTGRLVETLTAPEIMNHVQSLNRIPYTASSVLQTLKRVLDYAVRLGYLSANPAASLRDITKAHQQEAMNHTTDPKILGRVLLAMEQAPAALAATRFYLRILPYLACRPSELREALWAEVDGDVLRIPAERMKKRRAHSIPLPRQVQALLQELRVHTGHYPYLFTNPSTQKPITEGACYKILKSQNVYDDFVLADLTSLHGFRHSASTILHSQNYNTAHIEAQLAHNDKNTVRGTYNHSDYLEQRKIMMQAYADYLDELKQSALLMQYTI